MIITEDATYHCRTELQLHRFSYTWSIDNFWRTSRFARGLYFNTEKKYFRLYVSFTKDIATFFALEHNSDIQKIKTSITVSYSISLNTTEGKIIHTSKDMTNFFVNTDEEVLYKLPILYLKNNKEKYLPKETLTICFKFLIYDDLINHNICYSYNPEIHMLATSFVHNEKSDSLITFVIDGKRLQANKALLCLKSEVFKAMFNCGLKESANNEVEITDIKYDILQQLLFFLQTGYLSENVKTDTKVAYELIIAAEKYDLKDLKLICEEHIIRNTTKDNVAEHLKFAHSNNATVLLEYALSFIKLHLRDIMDTPNFITLMQEYHELLLQTKIIKVPEVSADFI
ncbi:Speckle-type POZ protein [Camponotus japonicus]